MSKKDLVDSSIILIQKNIGIKNLEEKTEWRVKPYEQIIKFLPKNKNFSLLDIGYASGDGL